MAIEHTQVNANGDEYMYHAEFSDSDTSDGTIIDSDSSTSSDSSAMLKHARNGHIPSMASKGCESCIASGTTRRAIHKKPNVSKAAASTLDRLHCDLLGPMTSTVDGDRLQITSLGGSNYVMLTVDEQSRYVYVHPLSTKGDAGDSIQALCKQLQTQFSKPVKEFHSDGGAEFKSKTLAAFFASQGTMHTTTTPHTPQHNGIAERMNRTLLVTTRALLHAAGAPPILWAEAVNYAAIIHNHRTRKALGDKSPFTVLHNAATDSSKLRVWGCDAHVMVYESKQSKLGARTWKGMFTGISEQQNAWRIYDAINNKMVVTRDVVFNEQQFTISHQCYEHWHSSLDGDDYDTTNTDADWSSSLDIDASTIPVGYKHGLPSQSSRNTTQSSLAPMPATGTRNLPSLVDDSDGITINNNAGNRPVTSILDSNGQSDINDMAPHLVHNAGNNNNQLRNADSMQSSTYDLLEHKYDEASPIMQDELNDDGDSSVSSPVMADATDQVAPLPILQPMELPDWYNSPVSNIPASAPSDDFGVYRTRSGRASIPALSNPRNYSPESRKQLGHARLLYDVNWSTPVQSFAAIESATATNLMLGDISLMTWQQAMRSQYATQWQAAMEAEIASLNHQNVGTLVKLPAGVKVLAGRWLYKIKHDEHNNPIKFKARYVVRGFMQQHGIHYEETYAPVASHNSIRMLLSLVAVYDLELKQFDFETAFLNAPLEETFVCQATTWLPHW